MCRVAVCIVCLVLSVAGVALATPVQWTVASGGNGHWYETFGASAGLTWTAASNLAQQKGGHLATITSAEENVFVFSLVNSPEVFPSLNGAGPVLGGYQVDGAQGPNAGWRWVTGEAWSYTNWNAQQPDDGWYFDENRLQFLSNRQGVPSPMWNDVSHLDSNIGGYVVEWNSIPEPSSLLALLAGVGGIGGAVVRRRGMASR